MENGVLAQMFKVGETIGKGSYGKVKKGEYIPTRLPVAIKILNRQKIGSIPNMLQNVKREIDIGMSLEHPRVIRVYDTIVTPEDIYIIMEYGGGGELFDYVAARGKLPENEAKHFFRQIMEGLKYCHDHRVVHRDLKLENLVLDSQGNVKIVDFGLSKIIAEGNDLLKTACGSPNYVAPELLHGSSYVGTRVDIWSCGVILYVLLTGILPFDDANNSILFKKIKGGVYKNPMHLSMEARDLIRGILTVNPAERMTISQIQQHPWFQV